MSKIDIDKFFRDRFLGHERNSATYNSSQWKNFEQLLEKQNGKRMNNKSGFSLNNMLFFMSSFVIIMLIPLLFLHSDNVKEPEMNHVKNGFTVKSISSSADKSTTYINNNKDLKTGTDDNITEALSVSNLAHYENQNIENDALSEKNSFKILPEKNEMKAQEHESNLFVPVKAKIQSDGATNIIPYINSSKAKKEIKQDDSVNITKKGKIKRSKILLPHFYYNGF